MFARLAEPPNLLYEPPPVCRGAANRVLRKLLPPECPPPPRWNPPPPLLLPWNLPPPRELPWWEPPPPREPPPRCLPNARVGAAVRASATKDVNRALKTVGMLISVSSSPGAGPGVKSRFLRIAHRNGADFFHVFSRPALRRPSFNDKLGGVGASP
jgi:hypothetical protein